jgi:hypothetical protein
MAILKRVELGIGVCGLAQLRRQKGPVIEIKAGDGTSEQGRFEESARGGAYPENGGKYDEPRRVMFHSQSRASASPLFHFPSRIPARTARCANFGVRSAAEAL